MALSSSESGVNAAEELQSAGDSIGEVTEGVEGEGAAGLDELEEAAGVAVEEAAPGFVNFTSR